ncbi:nitric oxide associated protein 1 [Coemansia sp. RSA 989]|nr:nitric oxide associated protein 1 [Coemansia sp. RSA 1821]KAJ1864317.1 nitric oxide associated protein 1 [Coemansia sp. RSA 989]KAJ2632746.1 nitric oxide associated protein 1 [Coemansia sp. RSA 1290]KAJ2647688.1 nitric oxide associated protein 1 [Coemansia sp. RSA 1250]KAJ2674742.1 nitric oxide associated protein 1 [Coemansia sp. RSA 1085]
MNQANVVKGLPQVEDSGGDATAGIPALAGTEARLRVAEDRKMLSDEEYRLIMSNVDDPRAQALLTGVDPADDGSGAADDKVPDQRGLKQQGDNLGSFDTLLAARVRRRAEQGRDRIICQRCHTLKHHNQVERPWKEDIISDPRVLRFLQYKPNIMIVVVCDLFDIPGSLIPHLGDIIGSRHPVILVANKSDLLPKDFHHQRLMMWFKRFSKSLEVNIKSIHFVSALKNIGIRELAAEIMEYRRPGQDVYMVGRANVGKSELINGLLRISIGGTAHRVLASHIPGTTMGLYGIPLHRFSKALVPTSGIHQQDRRTYLYDTPGVFSSKSIVGYLTNEELKMVVCSKRISPFTYILEKGKSVMLGGLGRIDLVDGPSRVLVTVFSVIRPHFTRISRADELANRMRVGEQTILQPPVGDIERLKWFPHQKIALEHEFEGTHKRNASLDVVFAGVGWIAITGQFPRAKIRVYSPFGAGVGVRPPMLPFEYDRVTSHMSSQRKTPK